MCLINLAVRCFVFKLRLSWVRCFDNCSCSFFFIRGEGISQETFPFTEGGTETIPDALFKRKTFSTFFFFFLFSVRFYWRRCRRCDSTFPLVFTAPGRERRSEQEPGFPGCINKESRSPSKQNWKDFTLLLFVLGDFPSPRPGHHLAEDWFRCCVPSRPEEKLFAY